MKEPKSRLPAKLSAAQVAMEVIDWSHRTQIDDAAQAISELVDRSGEAGVLHSETMQAHVTGSVDDALRFLPDLIRWGVDAGGDPYELRAILAGWPEAAERAREFVNRNY